VELAQADLMHRIRERYTQVGRNMGGQGGLGAVMRRLCAFCVLQVVGCCWCTCHLLYLHSTTPSAATCDLVLCPGLFILVTPGAAVG
jgi:hypothetical protein